LDLEAHHLNLLLENVRIRNNGGFFMIIQRVLCLLIGYIFGLFQTGYIYGKIKHMDIREHGSGNAGTTNAMRVLGRKAGIITYLGDAFKAIFSAIVVYILFYNALDGKVFVLLLYSGLGVMIGHSYPFYMGFKGGKGIAAASGAIVGILDWKFILLALITFATVTMISKYVSLGSLCMMVGFFIEVILFSQLDMIDNLAKGDRIEAYIIAFLMAALAFFKHSGNIVRLINGNERKIGQKKEEVNNG